jgi:ABC-2 type transport system permease protein
MAVTSPGATVARRTSPVRSRVGALADTRRSFATAVRLGWRIEANWTDPLLFGIYSVAKPVASLLMLVVMLDVVSGGRASEGARAFVMVGSALWAFVVGGMVGLAWSVLEDRERYRMLRYLYVNPTPLLVTLIGRGTARIATASMGALITLVLGTLLFGVPIDLARVDWALLLACLPLGLLAIVALGIALAAVCLQTRQESWSYPEAVGGALFLLTGAVFPLAVLPGAAQVVGLVVPLTWWVEGVRRALFPGVPTAVGGEGSVWMALTGTSVPPPGFVVVALLGTTTVATLAAIAVYRWSEHRARERGLIDQTTGS